MALLPILHYPDPRLHTVAKPVAVVDDRIRKLIKDMAETMYAAPGIGLAATQVDVHERVLIIDISEARDELQAFVNPEIVAARANAKDSRKISDIIAFFINNPNLRRTNPRPSRGRAAI